VYRTLPDHQVIGFVPGLGVTAYRYAHHGTVARAEAVLAGYSPGVPWSPEPAAAPRGFP
jgi:hypothetical protein